MPDNTLVYKPAVSSFDGLTYWRLYHIHGYRWTPDILTTQQLIDHDRAMRDYIRSSNYVDLRTMLPVAYQYFTPEWM